MARIVIGCRIDDLVVAMCEHCAYSANQLLIDWTEKRDVVLGVDWTHQLLHGGRCLGAQWSGGMSSQSLRAMRLVETGLTVWRFIADGAFDDAGWVSHLAHTIAESGRPRRLRFALKENDSGTFA